MPLQQQTIHIPISSGINEKVDSRLLDAPSLATAENVISDKVGALAKRNGVEALTVNGQGTWQAHTLFETQQAIAQMHTKGVAQYSAKDAYWKSVDVGNSAADSTYTYQARAVETREGPFKRGEASVLNLDCAVVNGIACYVWVNAGGSQDFRALCVEVATGAIVMRETSIVIPASGATAYPKVVAAGSSFLVFGQTTTFANIGCYVIDTTAHPVAVAAVVNVATDSDGAVFDVAQDAAGTGAVLAYNSNASSIKLKTISSAGSVGTTYTDSASTASNVIAVYQHPDSLKIFAAHATGGGTLRATIYTSTLSGVDTAAADVQTARVGAAVVNAGIVAASATAVYITSTETEDASDSRQVRFARFDSAGASNRTQCYHVSQVAKPYLALGTTPYHQPFFVFAYYSPVSGSSQPHALVCGLYQTQSATYRFYAHARVGHDRASAISTPRLSGVAAYSSGGVQYRRFALSIDAALNPVVRGGDWVELEYGPRPVRVEKVGACNVISGGAPVWFDGSRMQEMTPQWYPEQPTVAVTGAASGAYLYRVVYEWDDEAGNLHRSAPSPASATVQLGATSNVVKFPALTITGRDGFDTASYRATLYRTTDAGTIYYRVVTGVPSASTPNGMVTLTDSNTADATIQANEVLYTTGGELAPTAPPALSEVAVAKGRLWAVNALDRQEVWPSKLLKPLYAPEFAGELAIRVDSSGGDVVALARLDDKLIIFKETEIFAIFGDGPTDAGTQDTFSEPQRISTSVGCVARNSIVQGPFGILFQSARGIYQLTRDLQVQYIGAPVETTIGTTEVTSAVLVASKNEVRFRPQNVVWNYLTNVWSTNTGNWPTAVHALAWDGVYTMLTATGKTWIETAAYADSSDFADAFIAKRITSAWFKLPGAQGFQRVYEMALLGEYVGAHGVTIEIGYDYDASYTYTKTWTHAEITALTRYQLVVRPPRQKCEAIRFRITETTPGSATAGAIWTAMSLTIGVKPGVFRAPIAARR